MVDFSKARNGSPTCSVGGKYLHSVYNPEREAERFVGALQCDFSPKFVVLTEPGLPYCVPFLRRRFPSAKIAAVRFCDDFSETDKNWDFVFFADENFSAKLFDTLGEEGIACALFASWQPSDALFPKKTALCWQKIREAVLKSRDVIATRSFFARRWLKNTVRFFATANRFATVLPGSSDIVVAASGPSLKIYFDELKKYREKYFLIAVSSALYPLVSHGIIPDLCISSDGGQWAKRHLDVLFENTDLPVALSAESASSGFVLSKNPIVPLLYGDAPERIFMENFGIRALKAFRNGTVSGTAVQLALGLTRGRVFCFGLDLSEAKGFQHTQPNALDAINSISENRINTRATRLSLAGRQNGALSIYRDWFSSRDGDFSARVFRFSAENLSPLGKIADLGLNDFQVIFQKMDVKSKPSVKILDEIYLKNDRAERIEVVKKTLEDAKKLSVNDKKSELWLKNIFPAEYLHYEKYFGTEIQKNAEAELLEKRDNFFSELISDFERKWK